MRHHATERPRGLCTLMAVLFALGLLASGPATLAQHEHLHDEQRVAAGTEIGAVDFGVACDEAVQADFDRALALLHHMMYAQARDAFEALAAAQPECAMAHWGVATTLFQPLWPTRPSTEDLERGGRLIERARELAPPSDRERLLIEATAGVFREPQTAAYWDRMRRWGEGMAAAYRVAPDDPDVAALYALSRLTLAQVADDRDPLHDEAERILRRVWEGQRKHPGAIHYTIHATDIDGRAKNALDIVEAYNQIAPEVPHALHMPSHIYVRLGDWPAVIEWNLRSADAALERPVDGAMSHHYLHAIDYLVYAYLQQGEDEKARAAQKQAVSKGRHQPSFISAFHSAAIPARVAVEGRRWDEARALEPRSPGDLPWDAAYWPEGLTWYARGLAAVHAGDPALAARAEARLVELRDAAREAGEEGMATSIEIDRRILAGWRARAAGKDDEAVRQVRSAAELEDTIEKNPVTPGALLPPNEALGDLLMDLDRPAEALAAYRASDEIWPGRYNTLLGAARAATAAGDAEAAREHYRQLLDNAGDSTRAGVTEARKFLEEKPAR